MITVNSDGFMDELLRKLNDAVGSFHPYFAISGRLKPETYLPLLDVFSQYDLWQAGFLKTILNGGATRQKLMQFTGPFSSIEDFENRALQGLKQFVIHAQDFTFGKNLTLEELCFEAVERQIESGQSSFEAQQFLYHQLIDARVALVSERKKAEFYRVKAAGLEQSVEQAQASLRQLDNERARLDDLAARERLEAEIKNREIEVYERKQSAREYAASLGIAEQIYGMDIRELGLPARTLNSLARSGMNSVSDVIAMTYDELSHVRNLGKISYSYLLLALSKLGVAPKGITPSLFPSREDFYQFPVERIFSVGLCRFLKEMYEVETVGDAARRKDELLEAAFSATPQRSDMQREFRRVAGFYL